MNLHLEKGATILGVDDAEGYPIRETRIEGETCLYYPALVNADGCDGFTISGEGVIDGHGLPTWKAFWELRKTKPRMLNKDPSLVRPRLLYVLISKFASSAAHAKGTTLVSAESCTWIDEHFCERPADIKAFLDRLFLSGVNHVFYHGLCYSPVEAVWPGWCFYASLQMNPRNPVWREMGALNEYVTRCQSIFQTWTPDNDLAILWDPAPYRAKHPGKTMNMSIHNRADWFYGENIGKVAKELYEAGYAFDYVSPRMVKAGWAKKYAAVVDPEFFNAERQRSREEILEGVRKMPFDAESGVLATGLPSAAPALARLALLARLAFPVSLDRGA